MHFIGSPSACSFASSKSKIMMAQLGSFAGSSKPSGAAALMNWRLALPWEKPQAEMEQPVALRGNMQILLCTDGFWEYITEEQIQICLEESDNAQIWMENMLELISRNDQHSERDNRTAITIWIDDGEGDITQ